MKCDIDENCTFEKPNFKTINILLIGQAQSGKSTIIKTISEKQRISVTKGYNESKEATLRTFLLYAQKMNTCYKFNFIDTVGIAAKKSSIINYDIDKELLKNPPSLTMTLTRSY